MMRLKEGVQMATQGQQRQGHIHLVASIFSMKWDTQSPVERNEGVWASESQER